MTVARMTNIELDLLNNSITSIIKKLKNKHERANLANIHRETKKPLIQQNNRRVPENKG